MVGCDDMGMTPTWTSADDNIETYVPRTPDFSPMAVMSVTALVAVAVLMLVADALA